MQTRLSLKYRGPAVDSGLMDVYEASANMIAFSDFVVSAAKSAYSGQVDAKAQVAGFSRGSFVTDLVFNIVGPAATILAAVPQEQLLKVVVEAVKLWKHLMGSPPAKIEHHTANQMVSVTNNNGEVIQVQIQTLNFVFDEKASEAAQRFVRDPLQREGIDAVEIGVGDKVVADVTPKDAGYFVSVAPSETVTDYTARMSLIIEAAVFKDENKWRFHDGTSTVYAAVLDKEFLAKVDAGELFGKGDVLVVDLRVTQERSGMKLTGERVIIKVHEHRRGQEQRKLF